MIRTQDGKFGILYLAKYSGLQSGKVTGGHPFFISGNETVEVYKSPKITLVVSNYSDTGRSISMHITIQVEFVGEHTIFNKTLGGSYGIASDLAIIYQHQAISGPDRYYCDTQIPNNYGWKDGIATFCAYNTQKPGTVPIYRHEAESGIDRYYYDTQIPNEYGWKDGVVLCYAYDPTKPKQPGTIAIYQHQASDPDRYYLDTQIPNGYGWSDGKLLCYTYPLTPSVALSQIH